MLLLLLITSSLVAAVHKPSFSNAGAKAIHASVKKITDLQKKYEEQRRHLQTSETTCEFGTTPSGCASNEVCGLAGVCSPCPLEEPLLGMTINCDGSYGLTLDAFNTCQEPAEGEPDEDYSKWMCSNNDLIISMYPTYADCNGGNDNYKMWMSDPMHDTVTGCKMECLTSNTMKWSEECWTTDEGISNAMTQSIWKMEMTLTDECMASDDSGYGYWHKDVCVDGFLTSEEYSAADCTASSLTGKVVMNDMCTNLMDYDEEEEDCSGRRELSASHTNYYSTTCMSGKAQMAKCKDDAEKVDANSMDYYSSFMMKLDHCKKDELDDCDLAQPTPPARGSEKFTCVGTELQYKTYTDDSCTTVDSTDTWTAATGGTCDQLLDVEGIKVIFGASCDAGYVTLDICNARDDTGTLVNVNSATSTVTSVDDVVTSNSYSAPAGALETDPNAGGSGSGADTGGSGSSGSASSFLSVICAAVAGLLMF